MDLVGDLSMKAQGVIWPYEVNNLQPLLNPQAHVSLYSVADLGFGMYNLMSGVT